MTAELEKLYTEAYNLPGWNLLIQNEPPAYSGHDTRPPYSIQYHIKCSDTVTPEELTRVAEAIYHRVNEDAHKKEYRFNLRFEFFRRFRGLHATIDNATPFAIFHYLNNSLNNDN